MSQDVAYVRNTEGGCNIICYNSLLVIDPFILSVATSKGVLSVQMHMSRKMLALRTVKLETRTPLLKEVSASIY